MCNCINELQEKVKDAVQKQHPDLSINYLLITATMEEKPKVGVTAFYSAVKTLKNGKKQNVDKTLNLIATHCPFCGEKYESDGE